MNKKCTQKQNWFAKTLFFFKSLIRGEVERRHSRPSRSLMCCLYEECCSWWTFFFFCLCVLVLRISLPPVLPPPFALGTDSAVYHRRFSKRGIIYVVFVFMGSFFLCFMDDSAMGDRYAVIHKHTHTHKETHTTRKEKKANKAEESTVRHDHDRCDFIGIEGTADG
jgi:hypothetical protein